MNDHELLKKLEESAKDIQIPKELEPEQIERRLRDKQHIRKKRLQLAVTAACLCICFGIGSAAYTRSSRGGWNDSKQEEAPSVSDHTGQKVSNTDNEKGEADDVVEEQELMAEKQEVPLKKIGKMFTLAEDYGEVYDVLRKADRMMYKKQSREDAVFNDVAKAESSFESSSDLDSHTDYSTTNLQVEGVDESDIVKTDGRYIYVVQEEQVQILNVQNKIPQLMGTIQPDQDVGEYYQICEMYVADHLLTLIVQLEETKYADKVDTEYSTAAFIDEVYQIDDSVSTKILTYNIENPENPILQSTAEQDGAYKTSRKINGRLYLFTSQMLYVDEDMTWKKAVKNKQSDNWIPRVNEKAVRADCIYLPKEGNQGVVMSSIDLGNNCKILDTKLLISDYAQLYVSQTSVYLYYSDYTNLGERTRIARFGLDSDGIIRAKAAASLKGTIQDTFAIHERDSYLQVLTSVSSSEPWENRVYVLDENMKVAGKLSGLAEGESIYSARFVGTVGYFVTYRNTDPLFTVDFSNPRQPKVIGELKVTGFSEYLHFWSDNLLLGIGYETNPEDGMITGVKLSMFDISNPSKVKEKSRLVLEDADDAAALFDYKCVLVDREKNIIAFTTENHKENNSLDYRVFSFQKGKFVNRLTYRLGKKYSYYSSGSTWRSLYIEDTLYLVNARKAIAFDISSGYKEIGKVKYKK